MGRKGLTGQPCSAVSVAVAVLVAHQRTKLANHDVKRPAHFVQVPCLFCLPLFLALLESCRSCLSAPPPCCKGFIIIRSCKTAVCLRRPLGPAMQVLLSRRCCTPLTPVPVFAANAVPARRCWVMQKGSSPLEADSELRGPSALKSMETPMILFAFIAGQWTCADAEAPSSRRCPLSLVIVGIVTGCRVPWSGESNESFQ